METTPSGRTTLYFEEAIEAFLDYLSHSSLSRDQVRSTLDEIERLNSRVHGYGAAAFARNLRETYERLAERRVERRDLDYLMVLGQRILKRDVVILPGVGETLFYLNARHRLLLLTKGDVEEQRLKVEASGLTANFEQVVIVREKDVDAYRDLARAYHLDPARTWMVGTLAEIGYQSRPGGRPEGGLHSARLYLAARNRADPRTR